MRKARYILGTALMTAMLAFSGCGEKGGNTDTADSNNTATKASTETEPVEEKTDDTKGESTENEPGEAVDVSSREDYIDNGLPVIYIDIDESKGTVEDMNSDQEHNTKCYGSITIAVPDAYECLIEGGSSYKGGIYELEYIKGRGNTTWATTKKPYKVKLDAKTDLFGMGKSKTYALMSNPYDDTGIRNRITNEIASDMGLEYSIQGLNVDVVMNGKYLGSYYLCETIGVGESRIEIDDLEKEYSEDADALTLSGGYLLGKMFADEGLGNFFETKRLAKFNLATPEITDSEDYAKAFDYIKSYVQETEDAIFAITSGDTAAGNYADYIDVDSAIKYYWLQEFSLNSDAFVTDSTHLYKKRDTVDADGNTVKGKLYYGPAWDFDLGYKDFDAERWYIYDEWIRTLMLDEDFADQMIAYWPTFKAELEKYSKDGGLIDQYAAENKASAYASLKVNSEDDEDMSQLYDDSIKDLKDWMNSRIAWIDANVDSLRGEPLTVHFMADGKEIYTGKGVVNAIFTDAPKEAPDGRKIVSWTFKAKNKDTGEEETQYFMTNGAYNTTLNDTPGTGYELTVEANFE